MFTLLILYLFQTVNAHAETHGVANPARPTQIVPTAQTRITLAYQAFHARVPSDAEMQQNLDQVNSGVPIPLILQGILQQPAQVALPRAQFCEAKGRQIRIVHALLDELDSQLGQDFVCAAYCRTSANSTVIRARGESAIAAIRDLSESCAGGTVSAAQYRQLPVGERSCQRMN